MRLFTKEIYQKLLKNGRIAQKRALEDKQFDPNPVVKLFTPDGAATWLLSELDPDNPDIAFGLCDLGTGYPELGYVCLSELESLRGRLGLPVEQDKSFRPLDTVGFYAKVAREAGQIVSWV